MSSNRPYFAQGVYVAEITQQGLSKAQTGNMQIVLRCKILGVPTNDGSYQPEVNQYERTVYLTITDKTIDFIADALENLGYEGDGFGPIDPSHARHQSFVGKQVDLYCKHEKDQSGVLREKWQLNREVGGLKVEAVESKEVRKLDQLYGKSLKRNSSRATPLPPVAAAVKGPEITDDDIPF